MILYLSRWEGVWHQTTNMLERRRGGGEGVVRSSMWV